MLIPEALPVVAAITLERDRQLAELGWSPDHDDEHGAGHLLKLAGDWMIHASHIRQPYKRDALVKAAALIVATIEVLDRTPPTAVCPECRDGKPRNCTGWAINQHDDVVPCATAAS